MIQSTTGATLPKTNPNNQRKTTKGKATKPPQFKDATEADFESAKTLLVKLCPNLANKVEKTATLTEAAAAVESMLAPTGHGYTVSTTDRAGLEITALAQGLLVVIEDRRGVIPYDEIAQDLRANIDEESDDEADTPIDSNGPAVTSAAAIAGLPGANPPADGELLTVDAKLLSPNPFQPRLVFDEAEIASLAASIDKSGQRQPVEVRPDPTAAGRFQIIDGERRWRAVNILKRPTLRVIVKPATDEQMAEFATVANLHRADLNAIEIARQYERLTVEFSWTQPRLAERFGVSQPQISNTLRLLQLPEAWQKRIISREIDPSHARALVPYAAYPAILDCMAEDLKEYGQESLAEWERGLKQAVYDSSRPLSGRYYDQQTTSWRDVAFKATDEQRKQLAVVEVKRHNQKEKRCLNLALWNELQTAGEKRKADRQAKAEAKGGKPAGQTKTKKKSAADLAAAFDRRVYAWRVNWLRYLCFACLTDANRPHSEAGDTVPLKLLLWLAVETSIDPTEGSARRNFHDRARELANATGQKVKRSSFGMIDAWQLLSKQEPRKLWALGVTLASRLLIDPDDGPTNFLPAEVVEGLAADLSIDLAAEWRKTPAPKVREFLELHNKEQLAELARGYKATIDLAQPKAAIVADLMGLTVGQKIPAEILKAKGGRK